MVKELQNLWQRQLQFIAANNIICEYKSALGINKLSMDNIVALIK